MHLFYQNRNIIPPQVDYVCHQDNNITEAPESIALEDEDELFADRVELEKNATQEDRNAGNNKEKSNKNSGELIRLAYQTLNQFAKKYRKKHSK